MTTASYELSFEVQELPEDLEDAVCENFDATVAVHQDVITVTLESVGESCLEAATSAIKRMRRLGVQPVRLLDNLVTRCDIARRAQVTPQAVGLWIRGERHASTRFPPPYVLAGGGLWLWGDVVRHLAARGVHLDEGVRYPTMRDSQLIGGELARLGAAAPSWTGGVVIHAHFGGKKTVSRPSGQVLVEASRGASALAR